MHRTIWGFVFVTMLWAARVDAAEYFVATNGNDSGPGTLEKPFKSLEGARDAVRKVQAMSATVEGVTVWVGAGIYTLTDSFELEACDSGAAASRVVYRGREPGKAILRGGKALSAEAFVRADDSESLKLLPPESHGHVWKVVLSEHGVSEYGQMHPCGFGQPVQPAPMELFFKGEPMQLARWPNHGFELYGEVTDKGSSPRNRDKTLSLAEQDFGPDRPGKFLYLGDRPARWTGADDAWLFGFWTYDWAEELLKIGSIDPERREIALAGPAHYGVAAGRRFYAINLLQELDAAGEYFVDRQRGVLYFWPPAPLGSGDVVISTLEAPMVRLNNVSHVTLRDLTFEASRGCGIHMTGGSGNRIDHCTIRNVGTVGVLFGDGESETEIGQIAWSAQARLYQDTAWNRNAGTDNGIQGCTIAHTGADGIMLSGGDRKTLTPGANFAARNEVYRVGRWYQQNHPAISVDGVGNYVRDNWIHDTAHSAIMYTGNDHIFEFNEIARCVTDSDDAGAIYTGRDPSARGSIIRHNYIRDIGPEQADNIGTFSIYFDDGTGGQSVYENVFCRGSRAGHVNASIFIHGGYDNLIENNLFIDCAGIGGGFELWGHPRWNEFVRSDLMIRRMKQAVDVTAPPYADRYPQLSSVYNDSPTAVRGNVDRNNRIIADKVLADELGERTAVDAMPILEQTIVDPVVPFDRVGVRGACKRTSGARRGKHD